MSQVPCTTPPTHPSEDPNSAYSILQEFKAKNPLARSVMPAHSPDPHHGQITSTTPPTSKDRLGALQGCDGVVERRSTSTMSTSLHMAAETLVCAPQPHASHPSTGRLPPHSITRDTIFQRIRDLLQDKLTAWTMPGSVEALAHRLTFVLIDFGQRGGFGPHGLSRITDIFMSIGHEGTKHYMALTVNPGAGDVQLLVKGDLCEKDGKDPLHDKELMEMLRQGFDREAVRQWLVLLPKDSPVDKGSRR